MATVRARKRIYCPHCKESVSHAVYYRHRERFYDRRTYQWTRGLESLGAADCNSSKVDDLERLGAADCNSSSSDEVDDLSTCSRLSLQSLDGLQHGPVETGSHSPDLSTGQMDRNDSSSNASDEDMNLVSYISTLYCEVT